MGDSAPFTIPASSLERRIVVTTTHHPPPIVSREEPQVSRLTTVGVIGAGAAGLTCALFLARAGIDVEAFDHDRSILKRARLENLPGSHGLEGRALLDDLRGRVSALEVPLHSGKVDDVVPTADGFNVHAGADVVTCRFVVIATGQGTLGLASLPLDTTEARQPFVKVNVVTDRWGATSYPGVWAAGVVAGWPSQAVVCAGSGANVAVEIVSAMNGSFWVDHDDSRVPAE